MAKKVRNTRTRQFQSLYCDGENIGRFGGGKFEIYSKDENTLGVAVCGRIYQTSGEEFSKFYGIKNCSQICLEFKGVKPVVITNNPNIYLDYTKDLSNYETEYFTFCLRDEIEDIAEDQDCILIWTQVSC